MLSLLKFCRFLSALQEHSDKQQEIGQLKEDLRLLTESVQKMIDQEKVKLQRLAEIDGAFERFPCEGVLGA